VIFQHFTLSKGKAGQLDRSPDLQTRPAQNQFSPIIDFISRPMPDRLPPPLLESVEGSLHKKHKSVSVAHHALLLDNGNITEHCESCRSRTLFWSLY
jgi:hypothetical protein